MSLSLRKMSGISMEIYCCLPKPHLLLTCHNVASAFFRRLERVEVIPPGNGSTGLWEGRSYPAHQPKRNWAKSSRPCSGKTPGTRGTLGWRGMRLILSTLGFGTASARPGEGQVTESGVPGGAKIGKSRSQGSPLC